MACLFVNMIMVHVDIIHFAYRGQKYTTLKTLNQIFLKHAFGKYLDPKK